MVRQRMKRSFVIPERTVAVFEKVRRPHVAQVYQDRQQGDIAYELVRDLRKWARDSVLGHKQETPL